MTALGHKQPPQDSLRHRLLSEVYRPVAILREVPISET